MEIEIKTRSGCYDMQWKQDRISADEIIKLMSTIPTNIIPFSEVEAAFRLLQRWSAPA
jgi:hypothetical protein